MELLGVTAWLVVGPPLLKNMNVNWDDYSQNVPNHQPAAIPNHFLPNLLFPIHWNSPTLAIDNLPCSYSSNIIDDTTSIIDNLVHQ